VDIIQNDLSENKEEKIIDKNLKRTSMICERISNSLIYVYLKINKYKKEKKDHKKI
jgi:hypothetical protein